MLFEANTYIVFLSDRSAPTPAPLWLQAAEPPVTSGSAGPGAAASAGSAFLQCSVGTRNLFLMQKVNPGNKFSNVV